MTDTRIPGTMHRSSPSAAGTSCAFLYDECDIQPAMTLAEYRRELDRVRRSGTPSGWLHRRRRR